MSVMNSRRFMLNMRIPLTPFCFRTLAHEVWR